MTDLKELEEKILSATTYAQIATALLNVDYAITERRKKLNYSGNLTDNAITEIEGEIRLLETLSYLGKGRVNDIRQSSYRANKINHELARIVRREHPELYEVYLEEAKGK